jgi:hypothetical protein
MLDYDPLSAYLLDQTLSLLCTHRVNDLLWHHTHIAIHFHEQSKVRIAFVKALLDGNALDIAELAPPTPSSTHASRAATPDVLTASAGLLGAPGYLHHMHG